MNIKTTWQFVKAAAQARNIPVHYVPNSNGHYVVYLSDDIITAHCLILNTNPANADQLDFEANFQASANRPSVHSKNIMPMRKSFTYTSAQTAVAIWTPVSGNRFAVTDYQISIHNNTLGTATAQIFDNANTIGNQLFTNMSSSGANYDVALSLDTSFVGGAINNVLKLTTSANIRISGVIFGYEITV